MKGRYAQFIRPADAVVNCLACLATNWEAEVSRMAEEGLLMEIEDLKRDYILSEHLITSGALSPLALDENER